MEVGVLLSILFPIIIAAMTVFAVFSGIFSLARRRPLLFFLILFFAIGIIWYFRKSISLKLRSIFSRKNGECLLEIAGQFAEGWRSQTNAAERASMEIQKALTPTY